VCVDISPLADFASLSYDSTLPTYSPSGCVASGGDPAGAVVTSGAFTICCR
jgi:hypothetical protein